MTKKRCNTHISIKTTTKLWTKIKESTESNLVSKGSMVKAIH